MAQVCESLLHARKTQREFLALVFGLPQCHVLQAEWFIGILGGVSF